MSKNRGRCRHLGCRPIAPLNRPGTQARFFYWFQMVQVIASAALTAIAYGATRFAV